MNQLLEALDLSALDPNEQEALLIDINEVVFRSTMIRFIEEMDDASREEFIQLLGTDPDEATLDAFIKRKVPRADAIVSETITEMANDILASTGTNQE